MKKAMGYVMALLLVLSACKGSKNKASNTENQPSTSNEAFDWMVGKWELKQEKSDKSTFEDWVKVNAACYKGHGYILFQSDTVWQEKMLLCQKDSVWMLTVKTPENNDSVQFTVVEQGFQSFVSENPAHDFPKQITYWKVGEELKAVVAGNDMEVSFDFLQR